MFLHMLGICALKAHIMMAATQKMIKLIAFQTSVKFYLSGVQERFTLIDLLP